ncbi:MAG: cysteine desulfurase family protein [Actinomycetota bacterium]|nr:cysteine desulfurase family protein [Actinomycetota bacterium]
MDHSSTYIYFDHSATTPVLPEVAQRIAQCFSNIYGNPSAGHRMGKQAQEQVESARKQLASALGANPSEIIFTSGGTESNNLAIFGIAEAYRQKGNHIISTSIEHPAVTIPLKMLERKGYRITLLPVDSQGMVDPRQVKDSITKETILVTIMHANNIFGTVQPIRQIGSILRQEGIIFHTDAVQSFCNIDTDVSTLNVDLLSVSGHKIYGPKGVGALYIKKGTKIMPQIFGGGQQRNLRSGTENVPGIVRPG